MVYVAPIPTVSVTIGLDQSRRNLQLAVQYLHELREMIGSLPIREVQDSGPLTQVWERINRIDLQNLCDDDIPF